MNQTGYWAAVGVAIGAVSPNFVIHENFDADELVRISMGLGVALIVVTFAAVMPRLVNRFLPHHLPPEKQDDAK